MENNHKNKNKHKTKNHNEEKIPPTLFSPIKLEPKYDEINLQTTSFIDSVLSEEFQDKFLSSS